MNGQPEDPPARDDRAGDVAASKRLARKEAKRLRGIASDAAPDAPRAVRARAAELLPAGPEDVVSGYWPIGSELDVIPLLRQFAAAGAVTALPVADGPGRPLRFLAWAPGEPVAEAGGGIMVPAGRAAEVVPSIVLVPMLAFDREGFRLGYGGGFYDRTLAGLRARGRVLAAGVAFAGQEMEGLPRDEYDQRLDLLLTERFAWRFS
jgi:5-formyltetrahydrofolate cyclo-ligase